MSESGSVESAENMQSSRKRKQISSSLKPLKTTASCHSQPAEDPYSDHPQPTFEECRSVRDDLLSLHGFPQEFVKYREQRLQMGLRESQILPNGGECGEKESVLDGLIRTVLSQNTTEVNSERAFGNLKCAFPTWEQVLAAESKGIEDAIRCGGLAPTKSSCIKNLLSCLLQKKGKLCLEYLRELSIEEIKAELFHFKRIGPKTVLAAESKGIEDAIRCGGLAPTKSSCIKNLLSCLLQKKGKLCLEYLWELSIEEIKAELSHFKGIGPKTLQKDDFPVDTHVFQISKAMGWVPASADIKKTYLHLNQRIPDELKFDLNCLLYTHGKACKRCSNRNIGGLKKETGDKHCPLLAYRKHRAAEK